MYNPITERDVVLIGKTEEGNDTFDFPVTRLANIEGGAEIKEAPDTNDYLPVIDASDNEKMKKTSVGKILTPLNNHIGDSSKHISEAERTAWNGKAGGVHTHDSRYYTEGEIDVKLAGKSDKGHGHSASEISGLPSSLPANGGNADTVGGKHASDFASASHNHDDRYYTEGEINSKLAGKSDSGHGHSAATQSASGFMSPADKAKLDGIAAGANAYSHPSYTARTGVPTTNLTPSFGGTFSISQPVSDGSGHITGLNTRTVKIPNTAASQSAAGLMSAGDKTKLNGIKLSNINVTFGSITAESESTAAVTIPHKVDLLFVYNNIFGSGSGVTPGNVILSSSVRLASILHGEVELLNSTDSAELKLTNKQPTTSSSYHYAAFQLS